MDIQMVLYPRSNTYNIHNHVHHSQNVKHKAMLREYKYKQITSRTIDSLMAMVQMQGMVARECISNSLLQHYAHVWLKWALFGYNRLTHTTDSYKVDFHVVRWFVDEDIVFCVRRAKVYWVVMIEGELRHIEGSRVKGEWGALGALWVVHCVNQCEASFQHLVISALWVVVWEFVSNC